MPFTTARLRAREAPSLPTRRVGIHGGQSAAVASPRHPPARLARPSSQRRPVPCGLGPACGDARFRERIESAPSHSPLSIEMLATSSHRNSVPQKPTSSTIPLIVGSVTNAETGNAPIRPCYRTHEADLGQRGETCSAPPRARQSSVVTSRGHGPSRSMNATCAVTRRLPDCRRDGANIAPYAFWPHDPVEPPVQGQGSGPRQDSAATDLRDPATPYVGALEMRRAHWDGGSGW